MFVAEGEEETSGREARSGNRARIQGAAVDCGHQVARHDQPRVVQVVAKPNAGRGCRLAMSGGYLLF